MTKLDRGDPQLPLSPEQRDARQKALDAVAREQARQEGLQAIGIPEPVFTNHYRCEECDEDWDTEWSCACDDECPSCGKIYTPWDYDVEGDYDEEDNEGESP